MPVFESKQGYNKSTGLRKLAIRDEWFTDNLPLSADSKEVIEQTRGIWIAEFADLSGIGRRDINHVKSFLSRQDDRARPAYGRRSERVPRQFITAGTTNDDAYLLDNENRRFWPAKIKMFDIEKLTRDAPQLWAEAACYEARGDSIALQEDLWAAAAVEQDARRIENPFTSEISCRIGDGEGWILAREVWDLLDIKLDRRPVCSLLVGKAMRELGFERIRNKKRGAMRDDYIYQRGEKDVHLWGGI
jgi:predicted P-loop ATPase